MITPARQALEATACAPAEGSAELPIEPMCVKTSASCNGQSASSAAHVRKPVIVPSRMGGGTGGYGSRGRYKSDLTNQRRNLRPWRPSTRPDGRPPRVVQPCLHRVHLNLSGWDGGMPLCAYHALVKPPGRWDIR